ncbi:RHS repeat domain-containing protein [Algoriphagus sp.]|uniref:RHS repeat domain-containing protein n=1 Tax=Algoriphagus sp. TaxID=1872435 RepID=UPI003F6FCFFC
MKLLHGMICKIFIAIFVLFLISNLATAQSEEDFLSQKIPNIIPPSPNAASLGKFGDIPVSLHTGIPSISIPIFEISASGNTLPISLDYHASGLKVEELGSSVGIGWALNSGGVISRTIMGLDDYLPGGYLYNGAGQEVSDYINGQMTEAEEINYRLSVINGLVDTQPDVYTFNFSGFSGKFVFNADGEAYIIPFQPLKILRDSNGFTIIDPKGIQYRFDEKETTFSNLTYEKNGQLQPYLDPQQYTSSWYMSRIDMPTGQEITFEYVSSIISPEYQTAETRYFRNALEQYCPENVPFDMEYSINTFQDVQITQKKISKINFPNGEISFAYKAADRNDLPGDKALEKITVKDHLQPIKVFELSQQYYAGRLYLKSISELDGNNAEIKPPYVFDYLNPDNFPSRSSKAQDFWGFYNGKNSNNTLVPKSLDPFVGLKSGYIYAAGADRNPNGTVVKNGIISKVTYPTKGYTLFEFEPHVYGNLGGWKDILDTIRTTQSVNTVLSAPPTGVAAQKFFTITHDQSVNIQTQVSGYNTYVRLYEINNGEFIIYGQESTGSTDVQTQNIFMTLGAGEYKLLAFNYEEEFVSQISVHHLQNSQNYTLAKNRTGGGIRVKRISDYDGDNQLLKDKTYDYTIPEEEDRSSGILVAQYNHDYYKYESVCIACNEIPSVVTAKYLVRLSTSAVPMSYSQGSAIEYSDVTVFEDGQQLGSIIGKAHTKYITSKENRDVIFSDFPFLPPFSRSFMRGVIAEQNYYKIDGSIFKPVKKVVNSYSSKLNQKSVPFFLSIGFLRENCLTPTNSTFVENKGAHNSLFYYVSQSDEIMFDTSGNESFKKTIQYLYDNLNHLQISSINEDESTGAERTTKYYYPDDVSSTGALGGGVLTASEFSAVNKLKSIDKHQINEPIQVEMWKGNTLLATRRTTFKELPANKILPHKVKTSKGTAPLEDRIEYISYDGMGNLLSVSKSAEKASFLWSYDGQFPVAESVNATYSQISFTSFETTDKGGWTYSGTPVTTHKTGKKGYNLSSGSVTKTGIGASSSNPYRVGFWARRSSGTGNVNVGGQTESLTTAWKWVEKDITSSSLTISGGSVIIDELRLYPADAMMTSYTYEPLVGMTSKTEPNGYTLIYGYDTANRLKTVKNEDGHILEHYEYNYASGN